MSVVSRPGRTRQLLELAFGMSFIGIGVATMLVAGLGVGPFDLLGAGIVARLGVGFTVAGLFIHLSASVVAAAAGRMPRLLPTLAVLAIGPVIDAVLPSLRAVTDVAPAPLVLLAGLAVFAFGIALYVETGLGEAPIEAVQLALEGRGWSRARARMLIDATGGTFGLLLGGPLGLGTVFLALATGPSVALASRGVRAVNRRRLRPEAAVAVPQR